MRFVYSFVQYDAHLYSKKGEGDVSAKGGPCHCYVLEGSVGVLEPEWLLAPP